MTWANRKVIGIDEYEHFHDYAEMRVLDDQEKFARTHPSVKPGIWRSWWRAFLAFMTMSAIWTFFIWAGLRLWKP